MGDVHRVRLHHLARHHGRAEQKHVCRAKDLDIAADVAGGTGQHLARVADVVDHQPLADNRVLDREGRIVKATVIGVGHGLILSGERRGTKAKCCGNL